MALFGRKASTQAVTTASTPLAATDVPPELQPYYADTAVSAPARMRRIGLFALPIIVFLVVLGLLIGGTVWLRHHSLGDLFGGAKKGATSQQLNDTTPSTDVTNPGTTNTAPAPTTPVPSQSSPSPTPATVPPTTTPSTASIPTTGPSDSLFVLAALVAVAGALGFHMQQARRITNE